MFLNKFSDPSVYNAELIDYLFAIYILLFSIGTGWLLSKINDTNKK